MGYIAKARITASQSLIQGVYYKLIELGYKEVGFDGIAPWDDYLRIDDGIHLSDELCEDVMIRDYEFIDCNAHTPNGTEEEAVKLFLELAHINSEETEGQWFYWLDSVDDVCPLRKWNDNENWSWWRFEVRRAFPLEVAEAFRDGRIEL